MVIEDIPRRVTPVATAATSRFAASIAYAQDAAREGQIPAFVESVEYAHSDKSALVPKGERILYTISHGVTSIEGAPSEMIAVANRSRVKDPVLHTVIAYDSRRGEIPTREQVQLDVEKLLRKRGYTDRSGNINQYVAFAHGDTENLHVHLIANRVNGDGTAARDSHSKMRNEWVAADVAALRGWEIVAGKFNQRELLEQAQGRGANEDEILRLRNREASTLDRLRATVSTSPIRQTTKSTSTHNGGRLSFVDEYGEEIRSTHERATTWREFIDGLEAAGLDVKAVEKRGKGTQVYRGVSFGERGGSRGASGTSVRVPWKALEGKYGKLDSWLNGNAKPSAETSELEGIVSHPTHPTPTPPIVESDAEHRLAALVARQRTAVVPADNLDRILSLLTSVAAVRQIRDRRRQRQTLLAQAALDQSRSKRRPTQVEVALDRLARQRVSLQRRVTQMSPAERETGEPLVRDELQSMEVYAEYQLWRHEELQRITELREQQYKNARSTHMRRVAYEKDRAWRRENQIRGAIRFFAGRRMSRLIIALRKQSFVADRILMTERHRREWKAALAEMPRERPVDFPNWLDARAIDDPVAQGALRHQTRLKQWRERADGGEPRFPVQKAEANVGAVNSSSVVDLKFRLKSAEKALRRLTSSGISIDPEITNQTSKAVASAEMLSAATADFIYRNARNAIHSAVNEEKFRKARSKSKAQSGGKNQKVKSTARSQRERNVGKGL